MKICTFFHISWFFVYIYNLTFFTPLFHKTTVNVQPLSPPVFNKIATHSKNLRFFILFVFGFACFQLVVIFVDFQIPLGTQLVQNGMKMVPNTDPLGCFLIQFRPTLPKKNTTHNTTNLFFRNLGPKTRFPFTLWPTTTWNPQPTTHPFWMDLWLFWDTLKKPMFANAFSLLYTRFWQDLPRSPKICQDLPRSTKRSASTNLQAPLAETIHETPSSKNEGAAVSRRMASSITLGLKETNK